MFVLQLCKNTPGPPGRLQVDIYKVAGGGCDSILVLCSFSMLPNGCLVEKQPKKKNKKTDNNADDLGQTASA